MGHECLSFRWKSQATTEFPATVLNSGPADDGRHAIINGMLRAIVREILILIGCLTLFPAAVILLLVQTNSLEAALNFLGRGLFLGQALSPQGTLLLMWLKLISPYLIVQAIRAYLWGQRSMKGRRWANLYFVILLTAAGVWSLWKAWDLFYFMYALGDMPAELGQFIELEGTNLFIFLVCSILAVHCFSIFLRSERNAP
jgi:hypothetical protein